MIRSYSALRRLYIYLYMYIRISIGTYYTYIYIGIYIHSVYISEWKRETALVLYTYPGYFSPPSYMNENTAGRPSFAKRKRLRLALKKKFFFFIIFYFTGDDVYCAVPRALSSLLGGKLNLTTTSERERRGRALKQYVHDIYTCARGNSAQSRERASVNWGDAARDEVNLFRENIATLNVVVVVWDIIVFFTQAYNSDLFILFSTLRLLLLNNGLIQ